MECREVTVLELFELAVILERDHKYIGIIHSEKYHGKCCIDMYSVIGTANLEYGDVVKFLNYTDEVNQKLSSPFVAFCRDVDVLKYFEYFGKHGEWRSHDTKVREVFQNKLKSITDEEGMTKLQIISYKDNRFIYTLLGEIEKITGIGVMFSIPITFDNFSSNDKAELVSYILANSQLDGVYFEDSLYLR